MLTNWPKSESNTEKIATKKRKQDQTKVSFRSKSGLCISDKYFNVSFIYFLGNFFSL